MTIFNMHDVVNFAIRIEENGEKFYREAAEIIPDGPVRELFTRLAEEETVHKRTSKGCWRASATTSRPKRMMASTLPT